MNRLLINVMLCIMLALFAGCRHVPMVSRAEDAASKQFSAPARNVAGIYVYRNSGWSGKTQVKSIWLDGQLLGGLPNKTYFNVEVAPGAHTLSAQSAPSPNDLHFTVSGGKNYFFSEEFSKKVPVVGAVVSPFVSVVTFQAVSEQDGRSNVLECQQAALRAYAETAAEPEQPAVAAVTAFKTTQPDCINALESDPDLQSIKKKVALSGKEDNLSSLMTIKERPAPGDRKVIMRWWDKRQRCLNDNPPPRDVYYPLSVESFNLGQKLIQELSKGEMSYGQFATRRNEIKQSTVTKAQSLQTK